MRNFFILCGNHSYLSLEHSKKTRDSNYIRAVYVVARHLVIYNNTFVPINAVMVMHCPFFLASYKEKIYTSLDKRYYRYLV